MRLQTLTLRQFRNYHELQLDISAGAVHLFIGQNGSGKTNILEAISTLSLSKSSIGTEEEHLIEWGQFFYRISTSVLADNGETATQEVAFQTSPRRQKACFVNDVKVNVAEFVGRVPSVLFLPRDLQLFSGPPAERRRFVDQLLCQVSPEYFRGLSEYQRILKQRNVLLKQIAQGNARPNDLLPWDVKLAERGALITVARLELMEMFSLTLGAETESLGEHWEDVRIVYERSVDAREQSQLEEELIGALERNRGRDIQLQSTSVGPHRDDWYLDADGHRLQTFASRGQQRACVLALLFLQASFLELRRGERPIVLLDDVFSELDDHHQEGVLTAFSDHQVFITGTHVPRQIGDSIVWDVKQGIVEQRSVGAIG